MGEDIAERNDLPIIPHGVDLFRRNLERAVQGLPDDFKRTLHSQAGPIVGRVLEVVPVQGAKMRLIAGQQNAAPAANGNPKHGAVFDRPVRDDFRWEKTRELADDLSLKGLFNGEF